MKYVIERFSNGVRFVFVPMPSNPAVTAMVLVGVGSEFERAEESGLSHFFEHILFKGTQKRPRSIDISRELDGLGASYNAFTSHEHTALHIKAANVHFEKIIDILADLVLNSTFDEDDIARERGVIIEEINMYNDLPQRKVSEIFSALLYGDQPAGRSILGTKKTVRSFSSKDFHLFKKRHYTGDKTVVVVAGGVEYDRAKKEIEKLFVEHAHFPGTPGARKIKVKKYAGKKRIAREYKKTDQTHFILGGHAPHRYHDDKWSFGVLSAVLDGGMSGRIFQRIREEMGVAYYADFSTASLTDHGCWELSAGVTNARTLEAIEASLKEIARARDELVLADELQKAKDHLIGSLFLSLETSGAFAHFFGFQCLYNEDPILTPGDVAERVRSVTAHDVQRVAREYFNPASVRLAIIGPHRNTRSFELPS
jgi:predicted Zn-dependent peptidase